MFDQKLSWGALRSVWMSQFSHFTVHGLTVVHDHCLGLQIPGRVSG